MEQLQLKITGISSFLMHSPRAMTSPGDDPKKSIKTKKILPPKDEAESYTDRLPDGQLYCPSIGFRVGIIRRAAKGRRVGKLAATTVIPGALFLTVERCPFVHPETNAPISEYEVDIRRAVVQRQGIRRARPLIREWSCVVEYEYDLDFITGGVVVELQNIAGKIAGVGDYRPEKGGSFGRYYVEVINDSAA